MYKYHNFFSLKYNKTHNPKITTSKSIAAGIIIGEKTHHQDHAISPHTLRVINIIVNAVITTDVIPIQSISVKFPQRYYKIIKRMVKATTRYNKTTTFILSSQTQRIFRYPK